ncbi:MAG: asparagine synthetase B [Bacteroidetes bacterium]|nr:MAG: asparagine synthetase B [Bacteroidota bacterium]PTM11549.1 MAG: asparagine synthetase B [Bacteroidota bacterium]
MKLFTTLLFLVLFAAAPGLFAQEFPDLDKSPMDMAYYPPRAAFRSFAKTPEERVADEPVLRVIYSRPAAKGRAVFGELVKYGEMWRIGANEATEITFLRDVKIGDQPIKAGRYTMYAMVNEKEWTVYFSLDLDMWGQYSFKPEASSVTAITVPVTTTKEAMELLGIVCEKVADGAHVVIGWENKVVRVPIQF